MGHREWDLYVPGLSPADYYLKALDYTLAGIAEKITCPTLVIDSEGDRWYPGQARQLFDAPTCDKTFLLFTAEEGAEDHCQVGSPLLSCSGCSTGSRRRSAVCPLPALPERVNGLAVHVGPMMYEE